MFNSKVLSVKYIPLGGHLILSHTGHHMFWNVFNYIYNFLCVCACGYACMWEHACQKKCLDVTRKLLELSPSYMKILGLTFCLGSTPLLPANSQLCLIYYKRGCLPPPYSLALFSPLAFAPLPSSASIPIPLTKHIPGFSFLFMKHNIRYWTEFINFGGKFAVEN